MGNMTGTRYSLSYTLNRVIIVLVFYFQKVLQGFHWNFLLRGFSMSKIQPRVSSSGKFVFSSYTLPPFFLKSFYIPYGFQLMTSKLLSYKFFVKENLTIKVLSQNIFENKKNTHNIFAWLIIFRQNLRFLFWSF